MFAVTPGLWLILLGGPLGQPAPVPAPSATSGTYLGILFAPNTSAPLVQNAPQPDGVVVTLVLPDSPAAIAGLARNDLLRGYNGQAITSCEQLARLIQTDTPGQKVKLELVRAGKAVTCEAKLTLGPALRLLGESRPADPDSAPAASKPAGPGLSARVEPQADGRLKVELRYYPEGTGRLRTRTLTGTLAEIQRQLTDGTEDELRLGRVLLDRLKQLESTPVPPRP